MKLFDKITQSVDTLSDYLSGDKYVNPAKGCPGCDYYDECTGKDTCTEAWKNALNREVEEVK